MLDREDLHLPAIGLTVAVSVVVQRIGCTLPRPWDIEYLTTIEQTVVVAIGVVGVGDVLVKTVHYLLSVREAVQVGIMRGGIGVVHRAVPNEAVHGLGEVLESVAVGVPVGGVGESFVVLGSVG